LVRLCGYTLTKLALELMFVYNALDRELDRVMRTGSYSELGLKYRLRDLENIVNAIRFIYPACPVLKYENVSKLKQDLVVALEKLNRSLEKWDAREVEMVLMEVVPSIGDVLYRINKHFIER
jgi:phage tail tape-measure protein